MPIKWQRVLLLLLSLLPSSSSLLSHLILFPRAGRGFLCNGVSAPPCMPSGQGRPLVLGGLRDPQRLGCALHFPIVLHDFCCFYSMIGLPSPAGTRAHGLVLTPE